MPVTTVAMLTAGGLAPCLSSAVGGLIERYTEVAPDVRVRVFLNQQRCRSVPAKQCQDAHFDCPARNEIAHRRGDLDEAASAHVDS